MPKNKETIMFALDVATKNEALKYIDILKDEVGYFKVGLELFIGYGQDIIKRIKKQTNAGVFLDLKLHDIPATVERAMAQIADFGVDYATVHCTADQRMMEAAVRGANGQTTVLGVTVLTSVSSQDLLDAGLVSDLALDMPSLVLKRARMAQDMGAGGVVCSGQEVAVIKEGLGADFTCVVPGIRPLWSVKGDQVRVTTPKAAIDAGADYLVVGRPIRDALDPVIAARKIVWEIGGGEPETEDVTEPVVPEEDDAAAEESKSKLSGVRNLFKRDKGKDKEEDVKDVDGAEEKNDPPSE